MAAVQFTRLQFVQPYRNNGLRIGGNAPAKGVVNGRTRLLTIRTTRCQSNDNHNRQKQ